MSDKCALWYWRYHVIHYELCDDEREAAESAVHMEDYGEASVAGVQFPDGRLIRCNDWDEYRAAEARRYDEWSALAAKRATAPKPAMRTIVAPFSDGQQVRVLASAPPWLGVQREAARD